MISYEPLYNLLHERKIAMQDLSVKIGFDKKTIASIAARHQHIPTDTLSKICEALSCRPEDVFEFVDEAPDHRRRYIRKDWQYSSDEYATVNWEKLLNDITECGYTEVGLSKKMNKPSNYIALRKNRRYT